MEDLLSQWVPKSWVKLSTQANRRREKLFEELLQKGTMPEMGWDQPTINSFIERLSALDSNNYMGNVGAGEREGRVYSSLVSQRHFGLAHGIGRSGDVSATQPKAPGSSVIAKLTQSMLLDLIRRVLLMPSIQSCLVLPCATGMTLTLVLLALKNKLASATTTTTTSSSQKFVIWTRIDQKTCLKAIISSGFIPIIVENQLIGDRVVADVDAIESILKTTRNDIYAVISTTSCFAPRVPDDVESIAKLCSTYKVAHIINNAYGLQCTKCCHYIEQACRVGRVDAIVQSTDKNFMVPVGGAIVTSPNNEFLDLISRTYPGRASMSPILDLFITLLEMGKNGYDELRKKRHLLVNGIFMEMLQRVAERNKLKVLESFSRNTISFALSLEKRNVNNSTTTTTTNTITTTITTVTTTAENSKLNYTEFGSMLFLRGVSGARVVSPWNGKETIAGIEFQGYGSSYSHYPVPYVTVACALGFENEDVEILEKKLNDTCADFYKL
jgi:O-phospho-L-seryl-tRNASec:L-selenocysteinyl-tRNA synthase